MPANSWAILNPVTVTARRLVNGRCLSSFLWRYSVGRVHTEKYMATFDVLTLQAQVILSYVLD